MLNHLFDDLHRNLGKESAAVVRNLTILVSLFSVLSANPSVGSAHTGFSYAYVKNNKTLEWIDEFQEETQLSDESVAILIDLFGEEELQNPASPLRLKLMIIYEILSESHTDPVAVSKILDEMVAGFAKDFGDYAQSANAHLGKKKKQELKNTLIDKMDSWVPEFAIDIFADPERMSVIEEKIEIKAAKRIEARREIIFIKENREKALLAGKISDFQVEQLDFYLTRDMTFDQFEPLPWERGQWSGWVNQVRNQYLIEIEPSPKDDEEQKNKRRYNVLVTTIMYRVCEKLYPFPHSKMDRVPFLRNLIDTYHTTDDLMAYARTVLHKREETMKSISSLENSDILPGWSNENIFAVLGSLDDLSRQISEEGRKKQEYVATAQDVDHLIESHFFERPVLALYLKYMSAVTEFPDLDLVSSLREKINVDADVSDVSVISSSDFVPLSVRSDMKIHGENRSDLAKLVTMKNFRYKTFSLTSDHFVSDKGIDVEKRKKDRDDFLVDIFNLFKKRDKQEQKKGKKEESLDTFPKDTTMVAAMMSYAMVYGTLPSYQESLVLWDQIQESIDELQALREVSKEVFDYNFEQSKLTSLSFLEKEKQKKLEVTADKVIEVLYHPKGTILLDNVKSDKLRDSRANMAISQTSCGMNARFSLKNMLSKLYPTKKTRFVFSREAFDAALNMGELPIRQNGEAYYLYKWLPSRGVGHVVKSDTKLALSDVILQEIYRQSIIHNTNVFELYFWTGYYPKGNPKAGQRKGHRTPVFINSSGDVMALDPLKGGSRNPFPLQIFFQKMKYIQRDKGSYKCVILPYPGYLDTEITNILAVAASNPEVLDVVEKKLGSQAATYIPYLGQYSSFVPPEVSDFVIDDLTIDSLMILYPDLGAEEDVSYNAVIDAVNNIKNTFDRRTVLEYIRSGSIFKLQQFLFGNDDEEEDYDPMDIGKYSGILDEETLRALEELNDQSFYNKNYGDTSVGYAQP